MAELGHILVIGATSGVGAAVVDRLAADGTIVTAVGRRADRLAALERRGVRSRVFDVCDLENIAAMLADCVAQSGLLTALVYCAGMQDIKSLRMSKPDRIQKLITVNLTAPLVMAAAFAARTVSTMDAVFCGVSSIASVRPEPGIIPYAVSKAGMDALIKGLARELAPRRAVGVAPGWLDTEMTRAFPAIYSEAFKEKIRKEAPLGIVTVEAVAENIAYLISGSARFVTGEILRVDGGASL